jgi:hypothetical protein
MQDLQQVCPADRVEGLGNVKLNEETGGLGSVELLYPILHIEEVVVDASGFNESALVLGDEVAEPVQDDLPGAWRKSSRCCESG